MMVIISVVVVVVVILSESVRLQRMEVDMSIEQFEIMMLLNGMYVTIRSQLNQVVYERLLSIETVVLIVVEVVIVRLMVIVCLQMNKIDDVFE
jgi:hypothetical protein